MYGAAFRTLSLTIYLTGFTDIYHNGFQDRYRSTEKDLQATRPNETDSAKVAGLLRLFADDENAAFASRVTRSK